MKAKTPKTPEVAQPIPVPQPDDPALIDTRRAVRRSADAQQGSSASLLTPSNARGVTGSGSTMRRQLGYGAVGY